MKIVVLTSNINEARVPNRIAELRKRGYELEVFCYCRDPERPFIKEDGVAYHVLGEVGRGSSSYFKRLFAEFKDIRKVIRQYKGLDVVFYLINNDTALLYYLIGGRQPFIYEEADLRHTYFSSGILRRVFEYIDKRIIRKSLLTVFVSKGFAKYHYGSGGIPENVAYAFNKLNPAIMDLPYKRVRIPDVNHLKVAFVGSIRLFDSLYNFAKVFCESFPDNEFHFYGNVIDEKFYQLKSLPNCFFHGPFSNPSDLPGIYSDVDMVLSTYDVRYDNVRYAEPNKIYESIYFEVPIVVSSGTYLAERVSETGVGYSLDAMNDAEVKDFISSLTTESLLQKSANAHMIPKQESVIDNDDLFRTFESRMELKRQL
jgi:glycosyltransferase involved in cell wall biosynthesis